MPLRETAPVGAPDWFELHTRDDDATGAVFKLISGTPR